MPTATPPGFRLGAIAPQDAMAAFAARGLLRPSFRWQDVWQAEHARSFASAGVMRLDVLAIIRDRVQDAVDNGTDALTYVRTLREQLVAKGWWGDIEIADPETGELRKTRFDDARLRLIYDVNLRQSHAAGRWARIQRSKMPFIVYRTMRDSRVRTAHRRWDNTVLPKDHPWWDTHFPPCGWRCRCHAYGIDAAGVEELRKNAPKDSPVKTEPPQDPPAIPFLNRQTWQTELVPYGIDPGFAYNPGKEHVQRAAELLARDVTALAQGQAAAAEEHALQSAAIERMRGEEGFAQFLAAPPKGDAGMPVAAIRRAAGAPSPAPAVPAAVAPSAPPASLPAVAAAPAVAAVSADTARSALAEQAAQLAVRTLPASAAQWALAQQVADAGRSIDLGGGRTLWWRVLSADGAGRVQVMELERGPLVAWVRVLAEFARDEALRRWPVLAAWL